MLDALGSGTLGCLAVQGEPGIGKTTILAELRTRAEARGHLVLSGASSELERDVSFGVWVDALDAYVASLDLKLTEDPDDVELADQLAGLLPSMGGMASTRPLADERYRAHRAMADLLERMAVARPLVVVLDDLHWADEASIELLGSLLRRGAQAPVLLALAVRSGQVSRQLEVSLGSPLVELIELDPLDRSEASQLAGGSLGEPQLEALYRESGGNPFYVEQLARSGCYSARGAGGDTVTPAATKVPRVVAAALTEELGQVGSAARRLLDGGSVAGDPFDPELAAAVGQVAVEETLPALDELLDRGLLRSTEAPRRFAFRHPLVRRAVYESTKAGWRLAAHGRAGQALAANGAAPVARAHHIEHSAAIGDTEAIALLLQAAESAAPRAPAGAARWYQAALRLMPDADVAGRVAALARLAEVQRSLGDLERCRANLLEAISLAGPGQPELRTALISGCAAAENFMGHHEQARKRLTAALEELDDEGSSAAVTLLLGLGTVAFLMMDVTAMRALCDRAVSAARLLAEPALVIPSTAMLALAAALAGDIGIGEASRADAASMLEALDDEDLAAHLEAVNLLGWAEFYLGRYAQAIAHLERGIAVARASGRGQFIALMTEAQMVSVSMHDDLNRAMQLRANAVEAARLAANPFVTSTALLVSSQVAVLAGDLEGARRDIEESVAGLEGLDRGIVAGLARGWLALGMLTAGEPVERADAVLASVGGWELPLIPAIWRVIFHEARTRIELAHGRHEEAERAAARAETAAEVLGFGAAGALAHCARAQMSLASGDAAGAATLALAGADAAAEAAAYRLVARCRLIAGEALAAQGERAAAIEHLRAAEAELDIRGAPRMRDEARRELRKLGARAETRGPASPDQAGLGSLSPREREIAELVTDRMTNREIATELFLSEKTVESHLRNIFVKLAASSRVDVARIVERERGTSTVSA